MLTRYAPLLAAVAVSVVVYAGSLDNGLVYDDVFLITNNETIKDQANIPGLFLAAISVSAGGRTSNYYRPFMFLVFMADYHIFGLDPWGFHLTYVLFHALVTAAVFLFTSIIAFGGGSGDIKEGRAVPFLSPPFWAALLFATHPIHTQVVAWNGAHEMGMTLFVLLATYFYVRGRHMTGALCFLLSAFFKETAMVLPAVLIAWDASFNKGFLLPFTKNKLAAAAKRYLPYLSVAALYMGLRTYALGGFTNVNHHKYLTVYEYIINVPTLFAKYLWKLLIPTSLTVAHTFHPVHSLLDWRSVVSFAVVAAYLAALGYLYKSRGPVFFLMILLVLPLLPVFYIPGLGVHVFGESYLYLPGVAFAVLSALLAHRLFGKLRAGGFGKETGPFAPPGLALALIVTVTSVYAVGTVKRIPAWKSDFSLWSDAALKSPDSYVVRTNMGLAYAAMGELEKAEVEYRASIELDPGQHYTYNNLGDVLTELGRYDEAAFELMKGLAIEPEFADLHYNLGRAYHLSGRPGKALYYYKNAVSLQSDMVDGHNNLGHVYLSTGDLGSAIKSFKRAIELNDRNHYYHFYLGMAYLKNGLVDDARSAFMRTLEIKPDYTKARRALAATNLR